MQLSEAAPLVGARTQRDATFTSLGFASHDAPRMLVFLESEAHLDGVLANPVIVGVLASEALAAAVPERLGLAVAANPRLAFYTLHNHLVERTDFYGARRATQVAASARVDASAHVAEHDVRIGERVVVEPRAVIMPRVVLEDDVIVRAGTVVGSQGLQASVVDGRMLKVAHGGGVIMRRGAEVHSNSCIDRAVFGGFTEVGEDSIIANLVYVAHNVRIGKRCRVAANAAIGGSTTLGDEVYVGPGAAISSELRVGDGAVVSLGAVVTRDVLPGQRVSGNFALDHERFIAHMRQIR